ncbi:MAG: DUF2807 domain-containing protein [Flammeovirgaceae bacterium]|nr:DUF2807 domain-containing protein [Flammeovirgaceae bacterium]
MTRIFTLSLFCVFSFHSFAQIKQDVPAFNALDVFGPFKVELIKADKESLELDFKDVDRDDIVFEVDHGKLKLKLRNRHFINQWRDEEDIDYIKARVYYVSLNEIEIEAGTLLKSEETIKSKNLRLACSKGAELRLDVIAKEVFIKTSMGGEVLLKGITDYLEIYASMGAELNTLDLESKSVFVKATMGADVKVFASKEIDISAGLGAAVDYSGGPLVRHSSSSFGADVNGQ